MPQFWEYRNRRGDRAFTEWRDTLSGSERARVDEKLLALEKFGIAVSFLKPVKGFPHLRKIRVMTPDQALRPLLCLGPHDMAGELTLLLGAREQNFKWDPSGAREEADWRRGEVKSDATKRIAYIVPKPRKLL